jgi:hypothetical protein
MSEFLAIRARVIRARTASASIFLGVISFLCAAKGVENADCGFIGHCEELRHRNLSRVVGEVGIFAEQTTVLSPHPQMIRELIAEAGAEDHRGANLFAVE